MEVELEYIINRLKGSCFERMPDIVKYYLYWIKWLLFQGDISLNYCDTPLGKFFNLYKKATIEFLLKDTKDNDKAFIICDKLSNVLDCLKCYEYRDFDSYKRNKNFIGYEVIEYLSEEQSKNIFVLIMDSSPFIQQMMKEQKNFKEQEEKLRKIQSLYEKGTKESLEEIERLCSISTVEETINKLRIK